MRISDWSSDVCSSDLRLIGRTKGGMNTKLHAVTDANGRPLSFFMTAGQVSDYTGAAALLDDLPKAQWLLGDRGYDADWFRDARSEERSCRERVSVRVDLGGRRIIKKRDNEK